MKQYKIRRKTMTTLIASQEMLALLKQARETVEIRDPDGAVIGHFAPFSQVRVGSVSLSKGPKSGKSFTLKEVYQHLLAISPDDERKNILRTRLDEMAKEETLASRQSP